MKLFLPRLYPLSCSLVSIKFLFFRLFILFFQFSILLVNSSFSSFVSDISFNLPGISSSLISFNLSNVSFSLVSFNLPDVSSSLVSFNLPGVSSSFTSFRMFNSFKNLLILSNSFFKSNNNFYFRFLLIINFHLI